MKKYNRSPKAFTPKALLSVGITAIAVIILYSIAAAILRDSFILLGLAAVICFVIAAPAVLFAYRFISKHRHGISAIDEDVTNLESNMTLKMLSELYMPVVICDENEKIIWYNRSFEVKAGERSSYYGKSFTDFCPVSLSILLENKKEKGAVITAFGSFFNIKAYSLPFDQKNMTLTIWNDCTELEKANDRLLKENPMVAFVVIDNLEELMQYAQESYRTAAAEVEGIIRNWAESLNGIFREYERDKFLLIFRAEHLGKLITSKFDILDKIRNVRVGESNLPVTVSIGISSLDGDLKEKEKASRSALDTALQRGGDQVALMREGGMDFYGGKVQVAQKRTKVRARVIAEELAHLMTNSDNILIMPHRFPDFDAIGAAIGVARLAHYCKTKVNIVTDLASPEFLKCYARLENLPEYSKRRIFIDFAEAQELLGSNTLLCVVDVNNPSQFEAPDLAANAHNIVFIDHHRKSAQFDYEPRITYIEPAASSSCEMVAEILEHVLAPGLLPREEAEIMLSGISLDTKQFTKNTGTRTFGAALYLRNEGANPVGVSELFRTDLADLVSEADFESNVIIYKNEIAITQNSDVSKATPQTRISAAKAADKLLSVEKIEASFVICQTKDSIHISARSNGKINVQLILEALGGGGHFDAAATRMVGVTSIQALNRLKKAIDNYLAENKN
ncbi:MAG: DHH family phosphoesterase [Clostridia bacterium]|nr:DHH family phosphoesterase [Clostridia bacterium]